MKVIKEYTLIPEAEQQGFYLPKNSQLLQIISDNALRLFVLEPIGETETEYRSFKCFTNKEPIYDHILQYLGCYKASSGQLYHVVEVES